MNEDDTAVLVKELRLIREDNREAHEEIRQAVNGGNSAVSRQLTATDLIVSAAGVLVVLILTVFAYIYTSDKTSSTKIHQEAAEQRKIISDTQIKVTTLMGVVQEDVNENKDNITKLRPNAPRFTEKQHTEVHRETP